MKNKKIIKTITGLRGLMIITIMLFHIDYIGNSESPNWYNYFFMNPTIGVTFFFMVSGFGLSYQSIAKDIGKFKHISILGGGGVL